MLPLLFDKATYENRRSKLLKSCEDRRDLVVLFNNPAKLRTADQYYPYRFDSNFDYVCGYREASSALLMWKEKKGQKSVIHFHLFVLPRDLAREQWDGFRHGPEGAQKLTGATATHVIDRFEIFLLAWLADLPKGMAPRIFTNAKLHVENESRLDGILKKFCPALRQGKLPIEAYCDINAKIYALRTIKEPKEITVMRKSSQINVQAHLKALAALKPGMNEFEFQALIESEYINQGCSGPSYGSIVASGANATVLHYNENNRKMKKGDLLLVDAGCEYQGYASDITRTWPVGAKTYSKAQRKIMDVVSEAHKEVIQMAKPGVVYTALHARAEDVLIEGMKSLKLLRGSIAAIKEKVQHKRYYPHGTGHWLGLDVHDPCPYTDDKGDPLKLAPGMVFTVEPGLYFLEQDEKAPKEFRGIGVRIEDDILVTETGTEILTDGLPRYADEIEAFL